MLPLILCGYIHPIIASLSFYDSLPLEVVTSFNSVSNAVYWSETSFTSRAYCHDSTLCNLEYAECWVEGGSYGPSWIRTPMQCKTTVNCHALGLAPEACCRLI